MIFLESCRLFDTIITTTSTLTITMSSVAEVLANLTFGANAALTKAFLDYCSIKKDKKKVKDILESFDELFTKFLTKDGVHFGLEEYHIKISNPSLKSSKKKSSPKKSRYSKTHKDGTCEHIFESGKNEGCYCNTKLCDRSDKFCRIHNPRTSSVACHGTTKTGKDCQKLASKQHKGKGYCTQHYNEKTGKKDEKKKKPVESSDEENDSDSEDEKPKAKPTATKKPKPTVDSDDEENPKAKSSTTKTKKPKIDSDTEDEKPKAKASATKTKKPTIDSDAETEDEKPQQKKSSDKTKKSSQTIEIEDDDDEFEDAKEEVKSKASTKSSKTKSSKKPTYDSDSD